LAGERRLEHLVSIFATNKDNGNINHYNMKSIRRQVSNSVINVGNMITKKMENVKTKGGTKLKLQLICPVDGYPGKQITISTPDHQMLNVIIPKHVMPGRPFNIIYTPLNTLQQQFQQNVVDPIKEKFSHLSDGIRLNVKAPPTSKPGDLVTVTHGGLKYNVQIPSNCPLGGMFIVQLPSTNRQHQQHLPPSLEQLEDQAAEAREYFQKFDTDHNGILDYHEFTEFLNSLNIPKSVICEEITRVDIDHSHTVDFNEFTIYYNLLMDRISRGNIKECLVHVVENPFPGSLPDAGKVVHFLVLKDVGIALVSDNLKKRITIQFNSIGSYKKENTQELQITLTPAKGNKVFILSFIDIDIFAIVLGELNRAMAETNDIRGQLASKQDELERLQREIDEKKKDLKKHMVSSAITVVDDTSQIHTEAKVEVLMEDTQKAADQHTQALAMQAEKKRSQLQQRLKNRNKRNTNNKSIQKETHARRATIVKPGKEFI